MVSSEQRLVDNFIRMSGVSRHYYTRKSRPKRSLETGSKLKNIVCWIGDVDGLDRFSSDWCLHFNGLLGFRLGQAAPSHSENEVFMPVNTAHQLLQVFISMSLMNLKNRCF